MAVVDGSPPDGGVHVRGSAALLSGIRTLNLLADGYITWLAAGTAQSVFPAGFSLSTWEQENQFGIGLSGMLNIQPRSSFFDLLLGLGTAIRWGARRLLLEARLYGGTAINMPITIGWSF